MRYTIRIEKPAEKFILRQPREQQERLLKAIQKLPHEGDIKHLQGKKSKGLDRLRAGDYRVIFRRGAGSTDRVRHRRGRQRRYLQAILKSFRKER